MTQTKPVFVSPPRFLFNLEDALRDITETPKQAMVCVDFLLDWVTPPCFAATPKELIRGNAALLEIALEHWVKNRPDSVSDKGFKTLTALYFHVHEYSIKKMDTEHSYHLHWCCNCGVICDIDHVIIQNDRCYCPDCVRADACHNVVKNGLNELFGYPESKIIAGEVSPNDLLRQYWTFEDGTKVRLRQYTNFLKYQIIG